tara:strand:- start:12 stop:4892 length:4881 start_codon:yes stop_codon:yes gene_type:complete
MPSQFGGIPVEQPRDGEAEEIAVEAEEIADYFGLSVEEVDSVPQESIAGDISGEEKAQQSQFGGIPVEVSEPVQVNIPETNSLALGNTINPNTKDPESIELLDEAEAGRQQMIDLALTRFPPDVVEGWKDNPIGFGEAVDFLTWSQVLPGGGVVQGAEALHILSVSKKVEAGEELTTSEQSTLDEFVNKQLEMGIRGMSYPSLSGAGGAFSYYGSQMPALMIEFALTGGVAKVAQTAAVRAMTKGVAKSALQKATAKQAGRVARVVTQSSLLIPRQIAEYGELRLGPWMVTDKGQLIFTESKDSPAMSALKAYAHVSAEVASELSGATIAKYAINPITKRLKTPLINAINNLPEGLKLGLFEAYKKIMPNATISKAFTAGGWNGMLAELGEERVADVLRETTNIVLEEGYTFDQVLDGITPTKDQLLLEAGLISALGSVKAVSNVGINLLIKKGLTSKEAEETISNMTVTEQEAFVEGELELESAVIETEVEVATGKTPSSIRKFWNVAQNILEEYDQLKEGGITEAYKLKDKSLKKLGKARTNASRANIPLAKLIAFVNQTRKFWNTEVEVATGKTPSSITVQTAESKDNTKSGINIDSYVKETGAEKSELRLINKKLGYTLFRTKGGMLIDQIVESLPQIEYWGAESSLADVIEVINQIVANPKLPAYKEKQADLDIIEKEIEILEQTNNEELEAYYENLQTRQEVETAELKWITLDELEASLEQEYPTISLEEHDVSMKLMEDYISQNESPVQSFDNRILESQTDAALDAEGVNIDPNESIFNEAYYTWSDRFGALVSLSKEAVKRGAKLRPGENTDYLIRQYYSVAGMAKQILMVNTNTINKEGQIEITGRGLASILDDFDNLIIRLEPNKSKRNQDLTDYLIARRYLNDLQQREDVQVTEQQKLDSVKTLDSLAMKYGDSLKWFDETAKEIYEFQKRILRIAVDSGNMKEETYKNITDENQNYIPFQRVLDKEFGEYDSAGQGKVFTNATINRVIKKIVGSEREIKDPIGSIIKNTFRIIDLAAQNRVAISISSLAEIMPEYIQPIGPLIETIEVDGKKIKRPTKEAPKGTITVFEDGKRKYYRVAPPILKAVEQMRPEQFNFVQKFFQLPASILRAGATIIPSFWVKNVLKDMHGALIQSKARPIPFVDVTRGLIAMTGKTDLYNQWMQAGGSFNNYMHLDDNGVARAMKDLLSNDGKITRYLKNPLRLPEDISLSLDMAVRIGTFAAAKRKGMSDTEAAFESRDATLDFARGGSASKAINRYLPFFNAGMQGADKLYRSMRDNPKATTMWAVGTITMPSLIIAGYYLYGAPDDERQEYLEIPQWQKDMFWVFKVGGEWVRYPKPFTLGYLFGSVPERFLAWGHSEGNKDVQDFWLQITKGAVGSISPIYEPSALLPPLVRVSVESVTNYNFFQGRNIYPAWMEDLPPEDRKTNYGSRSAEEIGKLLGVSPAKVDNALRGTLAGSSKYVTDAGDYILNEVDKWNGEEIPARPTSRLDIPMIRAFAMRFPTGSSARSTGIFYDSAKLIRQTTNKLDDLRGEERAEYREENIALVRSERAFNSATKRISRLNKRRNLIYDNLVMTGQGKQEELRRLDDLILEQAKRANEVLNQHIRNLEDEK